MILIVKTKVQSKVDLLHPVQKCIAEFLEHSGIFYNRECGKHGACLSAASKGSSE